MNKMITTWQYNSLVTCLAALLFSSSIFAQDSTTLTLEQAYALARQNYPMIRQKDLVRQTANLRIDNISKSYLPQLTLSGQATYQSAVTSIPIKVPGINIEDPSKDQYRLLADVNQVLYDGGNAAAQKNVQQVNAIVEDQKAEVELYKVKDRINQLFLGILFLDAQLKQAELVKQDIKLGIQRTTAQVNNGTALRSSQQLLEAELLEDDQRTISLTADRKGLLAVLSLFINKSLPGNIQLQRPVMNATLNGANNRPEMKLFNYQDSLLGSQRELVNAGLRPRASLFVEGGYGRPGLNLLKNSFDLFYTAGVRFNWTIGNFYTSKKEKQLLTVGQQMSDVQRDVFVLNTNTQLKQQEEEIKKLVQLIASDQQIIDVRTKVKESANAQLENGVITSTDFLIQVNAEDQARRSQITHELQLLQAQVNYQTIAGNQ